MQRVYNKDPYVILGVPPTATSLQVKQAYRKLARQYHPDLNNDPRAADRMKEINWANSILSDPQERALYDFWRSSQVRVEFHPHASPPRSSPPPSSAPRNPPPDPPRSQPHPNPAPRPVYTTSRKQQPPREQGCSTTSLLVVIFYLLMNILRPYTSVSQPVYYGSTQVGQQETFQAIIETMQSSEFYPTPAVTSVSFMMRKPATASSLTTVPLFDSYGRENLIPNIAPDSQEWEWINKYFPELTTPEGLSDEVTMVVFDQVRNGYQIKTRNDGEYWIMINRYDRSIMPVHFPLAETATPAP